MHGSLCKFDAIDAVRCIGPHRCFSRIIVIVVVVANVVVVVDDDVVVVDVVVVVAIWGNAN